MILLIIRILKYTIIKLYLILVFSSILANWELLLVLKKIKRYEFQLKWKIAIYNYKVKIINVGDDDKLSKKQK